MKQEIVPLTTYRPPQYKGEDVTGRVYGRYEVLAHKGYKISQSKEKTHAVWLVRCIDCDRSYVQNSSNIVRAKYSCIKCRYVNVSGDKHYRWRGQGEVSGYFLSKARAGAAKRSRDLEFSIDIDYVENLWIRQEGRCAYSDTALSIGSSREETTASLDRINSDLGYIEGNVQFVHKDINKMKWSLTEQAFLDWIEKIHNFRSTINA